MPKKIIINNSQLFLIKEAIRDEFSFEELSKHFDQIEYCNHLLGKPFGIRFF